jgi:hypothetical protein
MKSNKTATVKMAEDLGRNDPVAVNATLEQINAMSWDARQVLARELGDVALSVAERNGLNTTYQSDFIYSYAHAVMSVWGGKVKRHEELCRRFRNACSGLTLEQATAKVKTLIDSFHVRGAKVSEGYNLSLRVERAWAVDASLYVQFTRSDDTVENPDDPTQRAGSYSVRTELSWGFTTRDVANAVAAIKLYQELTEIAAEIEAVMGREHVIYTYGIPEPTPAPSPAAIFQTIPEPVDMDLSGKPEVK